MDKRTYDLGAQVCKTTSNVRPHGHAPHPATTFRDACGDLPRFGWADPYGDVLPKAGQAEEHGLQQWEGGCPIGFGDDEQKAYRGPPKSAYQRMSRVGVKHSQVTFSPHVSDHVVPAISEKRASIFAHLGKPDLASAKGNYKGESLLHTRRVPSLISAVYRHPGDYPRPRRPW